MPKIGFYDYLTFATMAIVFLGFIILIVFMLGLPGRIARARKHPETDAIYTMGWLGFLGVVPWIQAFIWAFKPTDVIDIRRFPEEEAAAEQREFAANERPPRRKLRDRLRHHKEPTTADDSSSTGEPETKGDEPQS